MITRRGFIGSAAGFLAGAWGLLLPGKSEAVQPISAHGEPLGYQWLRDNPDQFPCIGVDPALEPDFMEVVVTLGPCVAQRFTCRAAGIGTAVNTLVSFVDDWARYVCSIRATVVNHYSLPIAIDVSGCGRAVADILCDRGYQIYTRWKVAHVNGWANPKCQRCFGRGCIDTTTKANKRWRTFDPCDCGGNKSMGKPDTACAYCLGTGSALRAFSELGAFVGDDGKNVYTNDTAYHLVTCGCAK